MKTYVKALKNKIVWLAIGVCTLVASQPIQAQSVININAANTIKPVNRSIFGVSVPALYRNKHGHKVDLQSAELTNLLNELQPTVVNIQNTSLGVPFFSESTGPYSQRISLIDSVKKMNMQSDPVGRDFVNRYQGHPVTQKPTEQNYDDLLGFLETLQLNPDVAIRVPTIFTSLESPWSAMKVNIDPQTGANLVHYLNDPVTTQWGQLRSANGHPAPYNVKKFVLGNEYWNNVAMGLGFDQIVSQHNLFAAAMKQADPDIEIGFNLIDEEYPRNLFKPQVLSSAGALLNYNSYILNGIKGHTDFVTVHSYTDYGLVTDGGSIVELSHDNWNYILSQVHLKRKYDNVGTLRSLIDQYNPAIKLAVDEYSGPLATLGSAIYITDYIMYLLEEDIDYAAHWNLGLFEPFTFFGSLKSVDVQGGSRYSPRPIFHAMKMFTSKVKGQIVENNIQSLEYNIGDVSVSKLMNWPADEKIPSLHALTVLDNETLIVMVVNRNVSSVVEGQITIQGFAPKQVANVTTLNANSLNAHNDSNPSNVTLLESQISNAGNGFIYFFPAHSVTLFELKQ